MKNSLTFIWSHSLGYLLHHALFRINYFGGFSRYEYVYHLLVEELKSDPDLHQPEYQELRRIIGVGGAELMGCHGISDKEAAQKYERVFKKQGIVCSYNSDVSKIYQLFKEEYVHGYKH